MLTKRVPFGELFQDLRTNRFAELTRNAESFPSRRFFVFRFLRNDLRPVFPGRKVL